MTEKRHGGSVFNTATVGQEGYACKPAGWLSVCMFFLAQIRDMHVWLISDSIGSRCLCWTGTLYPASQLLSGGIGSSHSIKWINDWY